jgi:ABC-type sulfate/molybdate transport systems ATPase subunit
MAHLTLRIVTGLRAFAVDVDLSAGAQTLALVGPSGAGKTTVLRCVAGLRRPDDGRIALGNDAWFDAGARVDLPPERRSVGLVPQHYSLFPHMTVRDNVAFGGPAGDLMERLRIDHLAGERPGRLSGGERQRVALARALARDPEVLLLDEPLAALDAQTRAVVRAELQDVLAAFGKPALLVTHDFDDAAALADRVAVMRDGRVLQEGTPAELLARPADAFVAAFTGANVVHRGDVSLAVHPWEIAVRPGPAPEGVDAISGVVESLTPAGGRTRVRIAGLEAEVDDAAGLRRGAPAHAVFDPDHIRVLNEENR